jgi:hypothetical protein
MKAGFPRREFNRGSLAVLLGAMIDALRADVEAQPQQPAKNATQSSRREVIKQRLPGDPAREITLVEVVYPPGAGSPVHAHANGVMAYVVSGTVASQVGDGPEVPFMLAKLGGSRSARYIGSLEIRVRPSRRHCSRSTLQRKARPLPT